MFRVILNTFAMSLVLCLAAFMLHGCGKSAEASVAGTYDLDKDAMRESVKAQIDATEDAEEKMGMQMMSGFIEMMNLSITLNADGTATGTMTMMGESSGAVGTWTISGASISITMAGEDEEPETMTGTVSGDRIELSQPDDEMPVNLIFKRRQGA